MRRSEEHLFATGVEAEPLMDRAGLGAADVVCQFFPSPGRALLFVGRGNNGGDALVAGRHLLERGWEVEVKRVSERDALSPLAEKKLREFDEARKGITATRARASRPGPFVLVDGLLGIGASGPLRGAIGECAAELNRIRIDEHAVTVAVDIPTGVDGDTGAHVEGAVVADITVTMARVKAGLVADAALNHVGRIAVVPLDEIVPVEGDENAEVLEPRFLRGRLGRRDFDTHKSMAGRVGVVAGSRGFTGAALMCARGAARAGAGLVTLYALKSVYPILAAAAAAAAPEIMVKPVESYRVLGDDNLDALAIGPGLGLERSAELLELITRDSRPAVVDADALNALAGAGVAMVLGDCAGPRLLTPHPGEMARLWPDHPGDRRETAERFVKDHPVTLLLKGARTVIAAAGRPVAFNPTGHPGMASGGMGDVLTGICAGLLGQGIDGYDAACLGSWLLGRSAELAVTGGGNASVESTVAGDVLEHLGGAFTDLRRGCY